MRNLKKILSLALALVMVLSMMVTASAAFEDQDLINEKYAEAVEVMAELGILQGNGTDFNPAGTLTRAEAAVILSKVVSGKSDVKFFEDEAAYVENPFSDVPAWAVPYVLYCYQNEIVGGVGGDKFNAKGTLRGYDFAKMLLIAAGFGVHEDYVGDATKTYETKVLEAAKKADLLNGLTITLSKNITREQASQMALNAMKAGGETTVTYVVVDANDVVIAKYDDILPAHQLKAALGAGYEVEIDVKSAGSLLADVWGVAYTEGGKDEYGREADVYTFPAVVNVAPAYNLYFNTPETLVTYTNAITKADVKALSDAKIKVATAGAYLYDNGVYTVGNDVEALTELVGMGGANSVVEIYATKGVITNVVVIDTEFYQIAESDITAATTTTPEYVTIDGFTVKNTYGLKAGDVVAYTYYGETLNTVTKLEGTTAKVTGLSKVAGVETYTINGGYYTLAGANENLIKTALATGAELVYYFGANNTVVLAHEPGKVVVPDTVYSNFAVVLQTGYIKTGSTTTGTILNPGSSDTYAGAVKLLLADGKTVEVPVAIEKASADIKVAGQTVVAKNAYYYVVGGQYFVVDVANDGGKLVDLENTVVAYDDATMAIAPTTVKAGASGNVYAVAGDTTIKTTMPTVELDGKDILINSNTVFVVPVYKDGEFVKYTTVKGQAALGTQGIDAQFVVYSATYVPKTATVAAHYEYVAQVVFAYADEDGIQVAPGKTTYEYVMYTGYTVTEYNTTVKALVDVHSMLKLDGTYTTYVTLHEAETLSTYLVYELDSEGNLSTASWAQGTVLQVSDSFIKVDSLTAPGSAEFAATWIQTNAKTVVYGDLTAGNYIFWVANQDGSIAAIFSFAV